MTTSRLPQPTGQLLESPVESLQTPTRKVKKQNIKISPGSLAELTLNVNISGLLFSGKVSFHFDELVEQEPGFKDIFLKELDCHQYWERGMLQEMKNFPSGLTTIFISVFLFFLLLMLF